MGLPQANRLKHWRDFKTVYRWGIRRSGRYLTLRGLQQSTIAPIAKETIAPEKSLPDNPPPSRLGISISQKVSKKAVVRNRIKRQIRSALRQLLPRLSPGWKLVFIVKPEARECEYAQLLRELEKLLVKAEVLDGH
ncbi:MULTISPECIES: ribonuclease P protein component [Moorena]|uniref:Ribonuclease P protein component n=1 Tax=Moorena producens 3L TaxID=489825 RepID=F4XWU4_9CYAN|nr:MULTISPECIES: ribonuclease P protein component [Moorena]EGJ30829.1 ribonuclease P [Moorena producens 3L]NEP30263.1 ribonuclease P protein component [Moorena sp. SIO3B2]NEP69921.1 ribonuclease P protein component [Moorena sp. SIO3A5]NER87528.1 ribonuclease P protein component [Moorena sp. SIO3A2]NES41848.1 ribonuclease P protein component [Moorena sp. SIO2C4]